MLQKNAKAELHAAANAVAECYSSDVLLYNGPIEEPSDRLLIDICAHRLRRKSVLLVLLTHGGSAHAAYRMARCLQASYECVMVCIPGTCASAGTLLAIGAHALIMSDHGALGPLDVQLRKADELFESRSGLTYVQALDSLRGQSFTFFEQTLLEIKGRSGGRITLKTAMDVALRMTTRLFGNIYSQIDPMRLGEDTRAMQIAEEYGARLDEDTDNLEPGALQELVGSYPSHMFVIDRKEAEKLFRNVSSPGNELSILLENLGLMAQVARHGGQKPICRFMSDELAEPEEESDDTQDGGEREDGKKSEVARPVADSPGESIPSVTPIRAHQEDDSDRGSQGAPEEGEPPEKASEDG